MSKRFIATALMVSLTSPLMVAPAGAVDVSPAEIAKRKETIHSCLLNIYLNEKKRPLASQEYQVMVGLKPDDAKLRFAYGSFLAAGGEFAAAATHFKKAILLDPTNAKYNGTLGLMYLKGKKPAQALEYLKTACACPDGKDYQKYYTDTFQFIENQKRVELQKNKQEEYRKQAAAKTAAAKKGDDDDW